MNKLYETMWGKIAIRGLLFALAFAMTQPVSAWARDSAVTGAAQPERQVGDPLDTNDAGGSDCPREEVWISGDSPVSFSLGSELWSGGILLVSQYGGTMTIFEVVLLSLSTEFLEGPDAK